VFSLQSGFEGLQCAGSYVSGLSIRWLFVGILMSGLVKLHGVDPPFCEALESISVIVKPGSTYFALDSVFNFHSIPVPIYFSTKYKEKTIQSFFVWDDGEYA
jgi:hypothetical protein